MTTGQKRPQERRPLPVLGRRSLLLAGGLASAGVLAGSLAGSEVAKPASPTPTPSASPPLFTLSRFESTMLTAATVKVATLVAGASLAPGLIVATPNTGQFGPTIYDDRGQPVWIGRTGDAATDLRVQTYRGRPVLTYWAGRVQTTGFGQGRGVILDDSYRVVTEVYAATGMLGDLHEFELTSNDTALVTAYPVARADLSALGGPAQGWILDCHVQEVDVATGRLLFDWRASRHLAVTESYQALGGTGTSPENPYDVFHVNAVSVDGPSTLLVSARHTHALYSVDRLTGAVRWRLGGRRSDFAVGADAAFAWQHHARRRSATQISMFDNHSIDGTSDSRGLTLEIDEDHRTAALYREFRRPTFLGAAMGSLQPLPNGNVFVGWGSRNMATEFSADGVPLWEMSDIGENSYRVFRQPWTAHPATPPDLSARHSSAGLVLHASWNGATEVASWQALGGASASALEPLGRAARSGFETTLRVGSAAAVQVVALDAAGGVLGRSRVVTL